MASASQNVYAANSQTYPYVMSVSWSEGSTNIANNTTVISANGSFAGPNISFNSWQTYYLRLYWHDNNTNTDKLFATSAGFTSAGQSYGTKSVSGSITVTHKSDGSLSGYVKLRFDAPGTSGGWSPGTTDLNTKWTACTTIARASSISVSGSQLGSGVSVTIDRKSNSFTHKVEYKFVESAWTTASSNAATSASFTPPVSLATQIPSAETGALTVRVTTFNGSTQIGDPVTKSINLKVPTNIVPSLSGLSASRIDNGVPSGWGIYVKGKSQVKITASGANGAQGSTIVGYSISGPGLSINASSGTSEVLSSTGTLTYTCTVTDTRGRTASKTVSINVVDYTYPNISMSAERCTSDGTKSINGTYLRVVITFSYASVSGKNSIVAKSCSCNGVSNSSFASGTAFVLAANCSIGNHYNVSASVKDALGNTATASVEVTTSYRILNVNKNKNGLAIGKFSEKAAFEVNMDSYFLKNIKSGITAEGSIATNSNLIAKGSLTVNGDVVIPKLLSKIYPVGSVYITYNNNNPGNFLGGTWERFGQGRTLIGEGTGNDGSTSMSFTANSTGGEYKHKITIDEMPSHDHKLYARGGSTKQTSSPFEENKPITQGSNAYGFNVSKTGGDASHNNIQPYITVHFWKRTA
nr:MAG TPA: baseplate wedge protein [Caudoviricetes sp.]